MPPAGAAARDFRPYFLNWDGLGGFITGTPAVASWAANRLDVFVRGGDTAVWRKSWNGIGWSGYDGLGGSFSSGLAAASSQWVGWTSLDGAWPTDPDAIAPPGTGTRLVELCLMGSTRNVPERQILGI